MSFQVTTAFVQQFSGNVRFLAQQMTSRLRGCVLEDTINGETAFMEQLGATIARKVQARHEDSPLMNSAHLRRRVTPYDYDWGDLIDSEDKVRMLIDPSSQYAINAAMSLKRAQDTEIIGAFFANALTGKDGSTQVVWPNGPVGQTAGTQVGVNDWTYGNGSGNTGLTISKLISAKVALDAAEGDDNEERYLSCKAKQIGNLLSTTEATSSDYNTVQALVEGKIDTFMGFKFIRTELMQADANGFTRVAAWRKSAMGFGVARDINGKIQERPDKRFSMYVFADMSVGATRLEEAKLVEIKCA